jgi:DNA-directed RNA polymerase
VLLTGNAGMPIGMLLVEIGRKLERALRTYLTRFESLLRLKNHDEKLVDFDFSFDSLLKSTDRWKWIRRLRYFRQKYFNAVDNPEIFFTDDIGLVSSQSGVCELNGDKNQSLNGDLQDELSSISLIRNVKTAAILVKYMIKSIPLYDAVGNSTFLNSLTLLADQNRSLTDHYQSPGRSGHRSFRTRGTLFYRMNLKENAHAFHKSRRSFHQRDKFKTVGVLKMNWRTYQALLSLPSFENMKISFLSSSPQFLPMKFPSNPWNNVIYNGGYYTPALKVPLIKTISARQIRMVRNESTQMGNVTKGLDYLGETGWKINRKLYNVVEELQKRDEFVGEMPNPKSLHIPSFESFLKNYRSSEQPKSKPEQASLSPPSPRFVNMTENFSHPDKPSWWKSANGNFTEADLIKLKYSYLKRKIEKKNAELHSLRCDMAIKLSVAKMFYDEREFFFPHHLDFRGRSYPVPPNLSYLGSDLTRSLLLFSISKSLGEEGLRWLKINLANLYGNNKISFDDRVAWVDKHRRDIEDSAENPLDGKRWWLTSEAPFQTLACCVELSNAWNFPPDRGGPAAYRCSLPVHVDGSCNGLQHYAALGRDERGARAVNLLTTVVDGNKNEILDRPADIYSVILDVVKEKLLLEQKQGIVDDDTGDNVNGKKSDRYYAAMLNKYLSRKVIKQTVMTSVYGVTMIGARDQVQSRIIEILEKERKKKDKDSQDAKKILGVEEEDSSPDMFSSSSALSIMSEEEERDIYFGSLFLAKTILASLQQVFTSAKAIMDWLARVAHIFSQQVLLSPVILPLIFSFYRREKQFSGSLHLACLLFSRIV